MKITDFSAVTLNSGYWFEKEKLNREITINSVYEQFDKTGRVKAFDCAWREGDDCKPHIFWDSDIAKWIESAAYSLAKHPDSELERRIDELVEKVRDNQQTDGYFNTYFISIEPTKRFFNSGCHELYCAGHFIEAAIACDEIGKPLLLECMEKYISYIERVFVKEKSAAFATPGHEEIELALIKLYRHTGKKQYLALAEHFINVRGTDGDFDRSDCFYSNNEYNQSHMPVREQTEAVGHAVRAIYLYTGMAMLARETGDKALLNTCRVLFDNIVSRKMYVTGGVGSSAIGEAFTNAYDLPNDIAYAETCAAIAMCFFCRAMLENENNAKYADIIERELYNGVLSGISLDGKRFFYVNPLEINLNEHFENAFGKPHYPITQRPEVFDCSCCPPNITRLLATVGGYAFGTEGNILYINQYASAEMRDGKFSCKTETDYPLNGSISVKAEGAEKVALRIPEWCDSFKLNKPYTLENGYALVENDGGEILLCLDIKPRAVFSSSHVARDAYKLCVMRGPVVYCAEAVDNSGELHRFSLKSDFECRELFETASGLPELEAEALYLADDTALYSGKKPCLEKRTLKLIPYSSFANHGESDMRVWLSWCM